MQELISANMQERKGRPNTDSVTNDISADEVQILSSEEMFIEDIVGDDVTKAEQKSTYLKFCQGISNITKPDVKALFLKKADKNS